MRRKVLAVYWSTWMRCILGCCWITYCMGCGVNIHIGVGIATSREEAARRGRNKYIGRQCSKCGSTVRYLCSNQCVNCMCNKNRKKNDIYETNMDPAKTKQRIEAKLEELALMRELDCLS